MNWRKEFKEIVRKFGYLPQWEEDLYEAIRAYRRAQHQSKAQDLCLLIGEFSDTAESVLTIFHRSFPELIESPRLLYGKISGPLEIACDKAVYLFYLLGTSNNTNRKLRHKYGPEVRLFFSYVEDLRCALEFLPREGKLERMMKEFGQICDYQREFNA